MTDSKTATDELRRLLDERDVKYDVKALREIEWTVNGVIWHANEYDGKLNVYVRNNDMLLTPDQAIAATLGRPKVKKVRGLTYDEHGGEVYYLACSGCGEWVDGDLDCIGEADGPNFCGNCGGEFDGPLLCRACGELADMEFGDMCAECYWYEGEGNDEQ